MRVHCPTCLELFTPEEDIRCSPCGHVFHYECIQKWLRNKRGSAAGPDCPQCRKPADLNSLMKIYLAEADIDSEEDKVLERKHEDLENEMELTAAERNSLLDRVVELENDLKGMVEELTKNHSETTRMENENTNLRQKLSQCESEIEETGKIKDKWLKSKKLLQELEEKQGVLKGKLSESVKKWEDSEKQRKLAEKYLRKAQNENDTFRKTNEKLENIKMTLEKKLIEKEKEPLSSNLDEPQDHGACKTKPVKVSSGDWWERVDDNLILGSYTFSMPSTITEGLARQENIMGVVTMQPGTDAEQQESPVEGFSLASVMKIMTLAAPQAWSQPLLPGPPINMEFCNLPPPERDADKDKEIYAKFEQFLKKIKASGGCVYVQLTSECITLMGTYLTTTSNCSPQAAVKRMLKIQPEFKKEAKKLFVFLFSSCLQDLMQMLPDEQGNDWREMASLISNVKAVLNKYK